ncbi:MAG: hypothetical protein QM757_13280 [Paludibaculum sp.]
MFQPSVQCTGGGASREEPRGAPASAQAEIVLISSAVKEGLLWNGPPSLANHGGIFFSSTACRIAFAQGLACW